MSYNIASIINNIPNVTFFSGVVLTTIFSTNVLIQSYRRISKKQYLRSLISPYEVKHNHPTEESVNKYVSCSSEKQLKEMEAKLASVADKGDVKYLLFGGGLILSSYLL